MLQILIVYDLVKFHKASSCQEVVAVTNGEHTSEVVSIRVLAWFIVFIVVGHQKARINSNDCEVNLQSRSHGYVKGFTECQIN